MNKAPRQTLTAPIRRIRFAYVALFFCLWTALIAGRLAWLQVVRHSDFVHRAAMQQQRTFEVAPRRGVLYDRNLKELAMTVTVDSVYAVPSELGDNRESAAEMLAGIVHSDARDSFTSRQQMVARFNASRNFAWVARRVDAETATRVRELNLKGVYFQKEFKRFYPNNDLAAQVLGYVGTDDTGLGGLEREFDDDMHGTPGHVLTALDAKRHVLGSEESQPMPGENLVLSIDANIQYMAERALDAQMEKMKALHGTVVVQDPHTGQILALAISPRFNPNDQRHMDASVLQNLAVSDVYEPGSTFKLVTYSAAMDAKVAAPDDMIDCQGGQITIFGRTIHDNQGEHFGVIPVHKALEESSDVAAVKLALKIGPDRFYQYIHDFGFGTRSGVELPGETRGLLRPVSRWQPSSIGSVAIGQEVAVTPLQLVTMVSTIANGGTYLPPHILLPDQLTSTPAPANLVQESAPPQVAAPQAPPTVAYAAETHGTVLASDLPDPLPQGAHRVIVGTAAFTPALADIAAEAGPERLLMVDANQLWDLPRARRAARALAPYDIYWLEEPLPAEDYRGYAELRRLCGIPLAAGESLYTQAQFRDLLLAGAVDFVQPNSAGDSEGLPLRNCSQSVSSGPSQSLASD